MEEDRAGILLTPSDLLKVLGFRMGQPWTPIWLRMGVAESESDAQRLLRNRIIAGRFHVIVDL